jgi:hypothetical protein
MTPPHPAWVSPETWAILFYHEQEAGENKSEGGETTPFLPALKPRRGLPLLTAGPLAAHTDEQQQNQSQEGQHLPETTFFHALPRLPVDFDEGTCCCRAGMVPGGTKMAEREGFEPSVGVSPHTRLAGEHLQPLGHLSGWRRE